MKKVRIDTVENSIQPATIMRRLAEPLETTDVAVNYYVLESGDSFAFAFHRHEYQEEIFLILEGVATFDTDEGTIEVAGGEALRFPPGEFHRGWNRGGDPVTAIAIGAPLKYGKEPKLRECQNCGTQTEHSLERLSDDSAPDNETIVAICTECDQETGRWIKGSMPGTVP